MFTAIFNFVKSKVTSSSVLSEIKNSVAEESDNTKVCSEPRWQRWLPFTLVYGSGKIQPVYVWVTVFSSLGAWMIYIKNHAASLAVKNGTYDPDMLSDALVATIVGFIASLILLYNIRGKSPNKTNKKKVVEQNNGISQEGDSQP